MRPPQLRLSPKRWWPIHPPPSRWNPQARIRLTNVRPLFWSSLPSGSILYAWQLPPFGGRYEQTDNAYVRGQTTIISPQVSGYVSDVPVQDFQMVKAGDILVRIEDRIYSAKVAQARANVLTQSPSLDNSDPGAAVARGQRAGGGCRHRQRAGAAHQGPGRHASRPMHWSATGWVTTRDRDQQVAALRAAEAQLRQARAAREIGRQDVRTVIVGRAGAKRQCRSRQGPGPLSRS